MADRKPALAVAGAACTFFDGWVDITGTPEALEADDLILRDWLPIAPKRVNWQMARCGDAWRDDTMRDRDAVAVAGWELRRVAGGEFRLRIWPLCGRVFRGGPTDPTAPQRALARHRALVRAWRDAQFQAFMRAATAA